MIFDPPKNFLQKLTDFSAVCLQKWAIIKTFLFMYNPILMKFGEIVVSMSTRISPNFVKIGLLTKKFL